MKSSGNSSAKTPSPQANPPHAPSRKFFALTGRSATIDPRTQAVRPDLADVRLAEQVFAPHYAAPVPHRLTEEAALRESRSPGAETLATLAAGAPFELLDVTAGVAWGIAPGVGLVGYLPVSSLETAA